MSHGTATLLDFSLTMFPDAWYAKETSQPIYAEKLAELKEVLVLLDQRWRVSGQYLFLINDFTSREIHH